MKRIAVILVTLLLALSGCRGTGSESHQQSDVSQARESSGSEQSIEEIDVSEVEGTPQEDDREDATMIDLINGIIATEPLALSEEELDAYKEEVVFKGNYLGLLINTGWTSPSQINIDEVLACYEYFAFNGTYLPEYNEANPEANIYEQSDLLVDADRVESYITKYVEVDIDALRQSSKYEADSRGYRFSIKDGLGGMLSLYATQVWKDDSYTVVEFGDGWSDELSYVLVETFDDETFLYRAYICGWE